MSPIVDLVALEDLRAWPGSGPRASSPGRSRRWSWSTIRARGVRPSASAFSRDISSTAAAPSEICDELPAVMRPSGLNAGLSWESFSSVVSGRMPWSVVTSAVDLDRHDLALEPALVGGAGGLAGATRPRARRARSAGSRTPRRSARRRCPGRARCSGPRTSGSTGEPNSSLTLAPAAKEMRPMCSTPGADHDVVDAGGDQRRADADGLLAGAALQVDRASPTPRSVALLQPRVARDVHRLLAELLHAAGDHVLDLGRVDARALDQQLGVASARAGRRDGRPCSCPSPDARARSGCGRLRRSRPRGSRWSPLSLPNSRLIAYHRSQIGSRIRSADPQAGVGARERVVVGAADLEQPALGLDLAATKLQRAGLAVAGDVGDRVLGGRSSAAIGLPMNAMIASTPSAVAPEPAEVLGRVGHEDVAQELEAARVDRLRVAVEKVRRTSLTGPCSSSSSRSRSRKRWIFVADIGHSSPPMKRISRGTLNDAICPGSARSAPPRWPRAPGSSSTNAAGDLEQPLVGDADDLRRA